MDTKIKYLSIFGLIILIRLTSWICDGYGGAQAQLPLVINTWAFKEANVVAWRTLHQSKGNTPLDALVEGLSTCERLQCDGTVGYGGSPDENGETTLDALLVDGNNMNMGAVAGLRNIKHAARVARHVLENTKHSLLVGDAATSFAVTMGFKREQLSTPESIEKFTKWKRNKCQPNFWTNVTPDPQLQCGPYRPISEMTSNAQKDRYRYDFGKWHHDTIGMIVIGEKGDVLAGTSTNGAMHKIPGRVGDSPIPGAGAFADKDVGAAVATGDGDVMMRFAPSALTVEFMRMGMSPEEAAEKAIQRILEHYPDLSGAIVAADRYGKYSTACAGMEKFPYSIVQGDITQEPRVEYKKCLLPKQNRTVENQTVTLMNEYTLPESSAKEYETVQKDLMENDVSEHTKVPNIKSSTMSDIHDKLKSEMAELHLRILETEKALNYINQKIQNTHNSNPEIIKKDDEIKMSSNTFKPWHKLNQQEKLERINKEIRELRAMSQQTKSQKHREEREIGQTLLAFQQEFLEKNDLKEKTKIQMDEMPNKFILGIPEKVDKQNRKEHKHPSIAGRSSHTKVLYGNVIPTKYCVKKQSLNNQLEDYPNEDKRQINDRL